MAPDNHRLALRVVDIRGDNRPAAGDFIAHEFCRTPFTDGRKFHLGRDNPFSGIMHLRDVTARLGPPRPGPYLKPYALKKGLLRRLSRAEKYRFRYFLRIAALFDPRLTQPPHAPTDLHKNNFIHII